MKKQMLVVGIHSFIDVITNSSTELFICDSEKSCETAQELLEIAWAKWKEYQNSIDCGYSCDRPLDNILTFEVITGADIHNGDLGKYWKEYYRNEFGKINDSEDSKYLVIKGTDDNSIPYEFYDAIESLFGPCAQLHLG